MLVYGGPGGNPDNTTADYNVFRRLVLRQGPDTSSGGNPQAGISIYYASHTLVENVIVLDSVPASDSSNSAFSLTGHVAPPETSNNAFFGDLALNNLGTGWYLDHNGTGSNNALTDSIIWGSDEGVALYSSGICNDNVISHVTVGGSKGEGLYNGCEKTVVSSSIFTANTGVGLHQSSGNGSIASANWNLFSSDGGGARDGVSAGAQDLSVDPGLKYITRVEAGSACVEARIKSEMCTAASATCGFCAATSLTSYVWSTLGQPVPATF